jgi:GTP cyclohydrolase I
LRLNATPEEKQAREEKMAAAVRVILECIGEDPDREGLLRTPQRYAQALMWMTHGYEERLAGQHDFQRTIRTLPLMSIHDKMSSTMLSSPKTTMKWSL